MKVWKHNVQTQWTIATHGPVFVSSMRLNLTTRNANVSEYDQWRRLLAWYADLKMYNFPMYIVHFQKPQMQLPTDTSRFCFMLAYKEMLLMPPAVKSSSLERNT